MSHRVSHGAGMPDVERLTRKLERHKTSLSDLCQLYRASSKLPMIQAALLDHPGPHAELLRTRCMHQLQQDHCFAPSMLLLYWMITCIKRAPE